MCQQCQPLIKAIDRYLEKASDNLAATLKDAGFEEPKKTVKFIEAIEDAVTEALLAETDYFLAEAKKSDSLFDFAARWDKIVENDTLDAAIADIFSEKLEEFMPVYVKRYMAETDPELAYGKIQKDATTDRISQRTTAWIHSWSSELGNLMKLNSSNEIESILTTGLQNGDGIAEFTRQIMDSGIRDEYYKARRVAVTEVLRAHSVAQQEAFMQDPSVKQKKWMHTGGYRNMPRKNHVAMDGQIVEKSETFTLVGADGATYNPMYPRDSSLPAGESINCHCISQPIADEDVLGMSLEERQQLRQEAIDNMDDEWEKELDAESRARAGISTQTSTATSGSKANNQSAASLGGGLASGGSAEENAGVPDHDEPIWLEQLDISDEDVVISTLKRYEKQIVESDIENAVVITTTGEVIQCFGDLNGVYPNSDLGDKLIGAYVTHNHPIGSANEYSFSNADIDLFMESGAEVLRGVDEMFEYELTRDPTDIDEYASIFELDEFSGRHEQVISIARKLKIGYRRYKRV